MSLNEMIARCLEESADSESTWSEVASIISTVAWSVSFYGQVYENWKYKSQILMKFSVEGFSLDYLYLNMIGYTFYGIYSTFGFFVPDTKGAGTVLLGDLIFVYHAIPIVIVEAIQCCYYPVFQRLYLERQQQIVKLGQIFGNWIDFVRNSRIFADSRNTFLMKFGALEWTEYWNPISVLGYGKLVISFVKYSPAVYWNWKRKCTKGWSIFNIILDLVGGGFSLASGSVSLQNGLNVTKLFLAILTVVYDLIFVFQHYVLYKGNDESVQKLLEDLVEVDVEDRVSGMNRTQEGTVEDLEEKQSQKLKD